MTAVAGFSSSNTAWTIRLFISWPLESVFRLVTTPLTVKSFPKVPTEVVATLGAVWPKLTEVRAAPESTRATVAVSARSHRLLRLGRSRMTSVDS